MAADAARRIKVNFYDFVSLTHASANQTLKVNQKKSLEMVCNTATATATTMSATIFIHAVERANDTHCGNNHMF